MCIFKALPKKKVVYIQIWAICSMSSGCFCAGDSICWSGYLHREQVCMLMRAAVGQDSSSSHISPPPLCPLVRWGCWQANLSSGDIEDPCEVSCCNFCLYHPPPTSTLILKSSFSYTFLYLFCLETKHCLGFCGEGRGCNISLCSFLSCVDFLQLPAVCFIQRPPYVAQGCWKTPMFT